MPATTKKPSTKVSAKSGGTASKAHTSTHPTWVDMIKECIIAHPEDGRAGVSRPTIKKFVESQYQIELNATAASQLNRAIAAGSERNIFVLPKGPSGKIKLAPKGHTDAAKENATPAVKKPATAKAKAAPAKAAPTKKASASRPVAKSRANTTVTAKKAAGTTKAATPTTKKYTSAAKKSTATTKKTASTKKSATTTKKVTTAKKGAAKKAVTGDSKKSPAKPRSKTTAATKSKTRAGAPLSKGKPASKTAASKKPASKKA